MVYESIFPYTLDYIFIILNTVACLIITRIGFWLFSSFPYCKKDFYINTCIPIHTGVCIHMKIFLLIYLKYICRIHKLITLVIYGEWSQLGTEMGKSSKCLFYFLNFDYMTVLPFGKIKTASKANNNRLCSLEHYCTC